MTKQRWERPSQLEASRGVIAILHETKQLWNGSKNVDYTERIEYNVERMNRRISWGGSLPKWITVLPAYEAEYLRKQSL